MTPRPNGRVKAAGDWATSWAPARQAAEAKTPSNRRRIIAISLQAAGQRGEAGCAPFWPIARLVASAAPAVKLTSERYAIGSLRQSRTQRPEQPDPVVGGPQNGARHRVDRELDTLSGAAARSRWTGQP